MLRPSLHVAAFGINPPHSAWATRLHAARSIPDAAEDEKISPMVRQLSWIHNQIVLSIGHHDPSLKIELEPQYKLG